MRDYFAARAMQTLLSIKEHNGKPLKLFRDIAEVAYLAADAMLLERNGKP